MEDRFLAERSALSDSYEAKIAEARGLKTRLLLEREGIRGDMTEATAAMESDADAELDEIKAAYDKKLTAERTQTLHLKDENAVLKRKFGLLREGVTENLDDLERRRDKQTALYETIDTLEKDIKGHVKEIKERESTIADKKHRIFELKKKNQELEKFKFVLDYKITELKRQIQPRKQEMKELSQQISEMEKELRAYKKESADLQLDVTELELKSDGMDANLLQDLRLHEDLSAHLSHVKTELHEVFADIEVPKKLKDGIKRLYQRHVQNAAQAQAAASKAAAAALAAAVSAASSVGGSSSAAGVGVGPGVGSAAGAAAGGANNSTGFKAAAAVDDVHTDYQRQRHYLERSIDSHNAKCKKDMRVHIKEHTRIMQENIALTKEVNELRREKYHILVQQKSKDQAKATKPGAAASAAASAAAAAGASPGSASLAQRGRMSRTLNDLHGGGALDLAASSMSGGPVVGDETEIQQEQIRALKRQLHMLETEYQELVAGGAAPLPSVAASAPSASGSASSAPGMASARGGPPGSLSSRLLHGSDKLPQLSHRSGNGGNGGGSQQPGPISSHDAGRASSSSSSSRQREPVDDQAEDEADNWNNDEEQKEY